MCADHGAVHESSCLDRLVEGVPEVTIGGEAAPLVGAHPLSDCSEKGVHRHDPFVSGSLSVEGVTLCDQSVEEVSAPFVPGEDELLERWQRARGGH